jgi:hypothetical protein
MSIPKGGKLVVCGDTHGHLPDVYKIVKEVGMPIHYVHYFSSKLTHFITGHPSESLMLIFNGDFVDRGPNGMEVLLVLYTLKLIFPNYPQDHLLTWWSDITI